MPTEPDTDHWSPAAVIGRLRTCDDHVAAYLLAFALDPPELRACSIPLGVGHIDSLRDLTLAAVIAARNITAADAADLTAWVARYRSREHGRAAAAEYLHSKGRTRHDH
jgi:hypothetical protein